MKLSEVKEQLKGMSALQFRTENGTPVPAHFHVTEVGKVSRHFIDCGGTERTEEYINFQLWTADDHDHRLAAKKLLDIITLSEQRLGILPDREVEVEYQGETIGRYGMAVNDGAFILISKQTDCLAKERCGVPEPTEDSSSCTPGGGCC